MTKMWLVTASTLLLAACNEGAVKEATPSDDAFKTQKGSSSGLSDENAAELVRTGFLSYSTGDGQTCANIMLISSVTIMDKRVLGDTADVFANFTIKTTSRIDPGENLHCLNGELETIDEGVELNKSYKFRLERWESGWRFARRTS